MTTTPLTLTIVTQEKELLKQEVTQITAPTSSGEVTILPHHIPLFTRLVTGELRFRTLGKENKDETVVVSGGFMDVGPNNEITILADSATHERDITLAKAEEAKKKAEDAMTQKLDRRSFIMAEASLRKALTELKIARKRSSPTSLG